jgi:ubiquinone/menaquinone biosynthesis C-methylase UbiE
MFDVDTHDDENINMIAEAMRIDEYDDEVWADQHKAHEYDIERFIRRNIYIVRGLKGNRLLEIGCGTGRSIPVYEVTHAIEPCEYRFKIAKSKYKKVIIKQAFAEAIPFDNNYFTSVMAIGVWEHLRSDQEALIEVNRVLKMDGIFVFTLAHDEDNKIGRAYGWKSYCNLLPDYGFELIEKREVFRGLRLLAIAVKKVRDFDNRYLRKLQIISKDKTLRNFIQERDEVFL